MDGREARGDLVTGLVLLVFSGIGFWQLHANPNVAGLDFGNDPGPSLFPTLLLWGLGLSGLWLAGRGLIRWRVPGGRGGRAAPGSGRLVRPALLVLTLVGYVLALQRFGFLPATFVFSLIWVLILAWEEGGRPSGRRLLLRLLEAGALSGVVYYVFAKLVKVPLP